MARTTVFQSGNSQAIRIPAEFRLPAGTGVNIRRTPTGLAIEVVEESVDDFIDRIAGSVPDMERPPQHPIRLHPAWDDAE